MIIRRKHTANFTTIGNALFNDERLKADEIGIIGYLLSRPPDWEVRRPQLGKRFGMGREAIKRVVWNAMRHGWIVANRTRLADGRLFTIYEVRDLPGPELSDDDVRAALSLGSSEPAGNDAESGEPEHASTSDPPAVEGPPPTAQPETGQPSTGQPAPGNPYVASKKEATKYGFTKDLSTKRAREFSDVRAGWPHQHILSESASQAAFLKLGDGDKEACFEGLRPYLDDCHARQRKVCDLRTFITERRWERLRQTQQGQPKKWIAKIGTAQFWRWLDYRVGQGESRDRILSFARSSGGIATPSEWPPGTSPPVDKPLATDEDLDEFAKMG